MKTVETKATTHDTIRDRIVSLHRMKAGELRAHPKNWRVHPAGQREILRSLLEEVGYADALIAYRDGDQLVLIDGHLRQSLDPDQVLPVLELDVSAAEAELLLATLDPITNLAAADPDRVSELFDQVQTSSELVRGFLADIADANRPVRAGLRDPDDIPPVPDAPRSQPGDLWMLGPHRVLCADATDPGSFERLLGGARADLCWTDPPWGVDYVGKTKQALRIANDGPGEIAALLDAAYVNLDVSLRPGAPIYVAQPSNEISAVFIEAFLARGWRIRQSLIWVKDRMVLGRGDYHHRHEVILYGNKPGTGRFGRGQGGWYGGNAETSVFEIARPSASRDHPTSKPVELIRRALQNSSAPDHLVLDPFLGSGTTLIAAHQLGRRAAGIELDPSYVDVIVARWEAFTGERAVKG